MNTDCLDTFLESTHHGRTFLVSVEGLRPGAVGAATGAFAFHHLHLAHSSDPLRSTVSGSPCTERSKLTAPSGSQQRG